MARGAVKVVSINGALTVTFTAASGATPTVFSDEACTSTTALPATIADGANATFYFASPGSYTLSVKTSGGVQIAGDLNSTKVVTVAAGDVGVYAYDTRLVSRDASGDSGRHSPGTDLATTYGALAGPNTWTGTQNFSGATVTGVGGGAPASLPSWASGLTGRYDPAKSVYNETANLRKVRAMLGKAEVAAALCRMLFIGDSITMGANATAPYTKFAWPNRLRTMLAKRIAHTTQGFALLSDTVTADPRVVLTGTWAANGTDGIGGYAQTSVTAASTIAFTPGVPCDTVVVYYKQTADGAAAAAYSGAASGNINFSGSTGINSVTLSVGNANLNKTLTITVPAGPNNRVTILGFEERQTIGNAGGVIVAKAGINGATAGNFIDAGTLAAIPAMIAPHLTVIMLETNDYGNWATPIATYKANLQSIITAAKTTGDVLLIACPTPQDRRGSGSGVIPLGTSPVLSDYTLALYQLADTNGCALLDLQDRWGDYATANAAGFMSDDYHPNDAGHMDVAHAVYDLLMVSPDTGLASVTQAQTFSQPQIFALGDGGGAEAVLIGGIDAPSFNNTNQPYVGASNTGQLRLAGKAGGQVELVTDIQFLTSGNGFAKGPSQDYAGRFKGAVLLDTGTAPAAPASGWKLYVDSGDLNKLKAIASTGTIVTLGTP